ncbi:MAG: IS4 family transposase [Bryobacterales bacterium]|nr:IS4 family transposase [Bryobacterales bacterium]
MTPETSEPLIEDWDLLRSFLPPNWEDLAGRTGALRKLRKDKSPDSLLRTLLLHLACGHSLRETVVRARRANLADLSDVALLKRLRKSRDWLQALCIELFREQGLAAGAAVGGAEVRAFDGTTVKEPGRTGSLWRVHYSLRLPSLTCDFFKLTRTKGEGTGESLTQFPIAAGDKVLADRGYSTGRGIRHVADAGGQVTVRVNSGALRLEAMDGECLDLVKSMKPLRRPGMIGSLEAWVRAGEEATVPGRVCALRKTEEATRIAVQKARREARSKGREVQPSTLELAKYVILFTTVPEAEWSDSEVLDWYRTRWQVELTFKRFKSLAQLGALPKHHDDSAKAWLYGKLLVALLVEKLIHHASSISPWGYDLAPETATQRLA